MLGVSEYCLRNPRTPLGYHNGNRLLIWYEAPVYDVVEYEDVQFSNKFYQPSPYRGKPTPELEKAWGDLWKSMYSITPPITR
jgi:hypothetical protein